MKRNTLNFVLDLASLLVMFTLLVTGLLIYYILPPGSHGGGKAYTLFGWNRHDYGKIHFYLSLGLVGLMILHVFLHWPWICSTVGGLLSFSKPSRRRRAVYGAVLLAVLAVIATGGLLWAKSRVQFDPTRGGQYHLHEELTVGESAHITGMNTLAEVSNIFGIPVEHLVEALQLPVDVDTSLQLGRLKREYGFELEDVRRIVYEYRSS